MRLGSGWVLRSSRTDIASPLTNMLPWEQRPLGEQGNACWGGGSPRTKQQVMGRRLEGRSVGLMRDRRGATGKIAKDVLLQT